MSNVILRADGKKVCGIACGSKLQEFAMRWQYIVRQRHRWAYDSDARGRQVSRLHTDLRKINIQVRHLKKLTGIVEVAIPVTESDIWEARILPWEYVLAAASSPFRGKRSILVVRHLMVDEAPVDRKPQTYAIVETAPGNLRRHYDFAAERSLVSGVLTELTAITDRPIQDPTEKQLRQTLRNHSPDVIHLTGVDNRSGRRKLDRELTGVRDGLMLSDPSGNPDEVRAELLAQILSSGNPPPIFVGFNSWDSGARLAPMAIQSGIRAALGFQHTFDDAVAEIFFLNFYRSCLESNWNLLSSFASAWNSIRGYRRRIRGSSITLWSAKSLVARGAHKTIELESGRFESIDRRGTSAGMVRRTADPQRDWAKDLVSVSVRPKQQLNYSLLHNGRSLFEEFTLRFNPVAAQSRTTPSNNGGKEPEGPTVDSIRDLQVEVHLHVGTDTFPFRTQLTVGEREPRYDLAGTDKRFSPSIPGNPVGGIRLPLTSHLIRSVSERLQTSMFVRVSWHDQILYQHTHSVWLAPVDEWTLNERDIWWLPSFVQPRDPAVHHVIDEAQNYLRCLADRTDAGFDGYQSYDGSLRGSKKWDGIDRQVHAIWSSLVINSNLDYINPPPSYGEFTQRLRSPSQTVSGKRGTCIDLAILLAACLEWIEVHPVLFMMDDHAFPGYWRDLTAYQTFLDVRAEGISQSELSIESRDDQRGEPWVAGKKTYSELKGFVDEKQLIPLETVLLTTGGGYHDAIGEGRGIFHNKRNHSFHSMIDIASARQGNGITPLPLSQD